MPNTRSRKLIVVLAAGALTMFGASGAFAASPADHGGDHGGGGGGGGGNALCDGTPLAATPLCAGQGEQPPGGGGGGGGTQASSTPAEDDGGGGGGGGSNPLCDGTPLAATPFCGSPGQQPPGDGGGGGGQPSA